MQKRFRSLIPPLALALPLSLMAGCAAERTLEAGRRASIPSLDVVLLTGPEIQRHSGATISGGGLLRSGFSTEAVATAAGKALRERCHLEDIGELVMQRFVAGAPRRIPGWPVMDVRESDAPALIPRTSSNKDGYALTFAPEYVWLFSVGPKGLNTSVMGTLVGPGGEVIWKHRAPYAERDAGHERELSELEANDCALLKDEMHYAAGVMAADLVADLKQQRQRQSVQQGAIRAARAWKTGLSR